MLRGRDARGEAAAHALLARAAMACGRPEDAIRHLEGERAALGGEASEFSLGVNEETEAGCRVARFEFAAGLRLFESAERRFAAAGAAFQAALQDRRDLDLALIPGEAVNDRGLFLDDLAFDELASSQAVPVLLSRTFVDAAAEPLAA